MITHKCPLCYFQIQSNSYQITQRFLREHALDTHRIHALKIIGIGQFTRFESYEKMPDVIPTPDNDRIKPNSIMNIDNDRAH